MTVTDRAFAWSPDEAVRELHRLGFYCMELEVVPDHVVVSVWRKYHRDERFAVSGPTLAEAFAKAVERAGAKSGPDPTALHNAHRLVSAHRCVCGWEGDSALTHLLDVLQIEEVDVRILPTGSLVGGLASYDLEGARRLYTIGGLPGVRA